MNVSTGLCEEPLGDPALNNTSSFPREQGTHTYNRIFCRGHDPITHVRRARYLTVVGDPFLSVPLPFIVSLLSVAVHTDDGGVWRSCAFDVFFFFHVNVIMRAPWRPGKDVGQGQRRNDFFNRERPLHAASRKNQRPLRGHLAPQQSERKQWRFTAFPSLVGTGRLPARRVDRSRAKRRRGWPSADKAGWFLLGFP